MLTLEKHERLKISKIAEILGHSIPEYIAFETNYLIYHPKISQTRDSKAGFVLSSAPDKKDITIDDEVWLNTTFNKYIRWAI